MKLNFWQWLGVVLLVIALVLILTRRTTNGPDGTPRTVEEPSAAEVLDPSTPVPPPTTMPAEPAD